MIRKRRAETISRTEHVETRSVARPILALALALVASSSIPLSSTFDFPSECSQPTSDSCPTCCKNLRNLAPAGNPAFVARNVRHVESCIVICANHTFYGLSNRHICGCFDECSVIEVPPSPFSVVSGYVKACLGSCFDPDPSWSLCECPQHAKCLPGKDSTHRCCCKAPFGQPSEVNGRIVCSRSDGWEEPLELL